MSGIGKIFQSSFLLSVESILRKLVGLVSTLILARILVPEDFGLIAIAMMIMGFIDAMRSFGGQKYLLKEDTITVDMVNTNFTINCCANWFLITLLLLFEPFITEYDQDERLTNIIRAFAFVWFIRPLGNPGLIYLKREQNYLPIVKLSIVTKIMAVITVIITALTLKNYWALVIGQLMTYSLLNIGSYFLHSHRPRFCLKGLKAQWNFSSWWTLQNILGYWKAHLDTFLVSSFFDKTVLGSYHTIKYFSSMPITFILEPATQPLLVALSKIKSNKEYFSTQLNVTFISTLAIGAPIACFCIQQHALLTEVLLGENWLEHSYLFGIFSLAIVTYAFMRQATEVLVIFGKTKIVFNIQLLSFVAVYGTLLALPIETIAEFANIKILIEAGLAVLAFIIVSAIFTSVRSVLASLYAAVPVFVAVLVAMQFVPDMTEQDWILMQLVVKTLVFFGVYALLLLAIGYVIKRSSPEWRYIWSLLNKVYGKFFKNVAV